MFRKVRLVNYFIPGCQFLLKNLKVLQTPASIDKSQQNLLLRALLYKPRLNGPYMKACVLKVYIHFAVSIRRIQYFLLKLDLNFLQSIILCTNHKILHIRKDFSKVLVIK